MYELSLYILDIAQNSVRANASLITIKVLADRKADTLTVEIADNGCGMDAEFLKSVTDPFTTTRTTRKVGLGIPLFKMSALDTGGTFDIKSTKNVGTTTTAVYVLSSVDRVPLGDIAETVSLLINGAGKADVLFMYALDGESYTFDTREVKSALDTDDLTDPITSEYLKAMIGENISKINGGFII